MSQREDMDPTGCLAGCDRTRREPYAQPTPGQLIHSLHSMSGEEQLDTAQRMLESSASAIRCFTLNHEGRLARDDHERTTLLWLHAEKVWQLEQAEASRRDWAAEAMQMEMADEARHCSGSSTCPADVHHEGCSYRIAGFCCSEPQPTIDAGEPDENVTTCGNCGEDMDGDMLDRLRYAPIAMSRAVHPEADR